MPVQPDFFTEWVIPGILATLLLLMAIFSALGWTGLASWLPNWLTGFPDHDPRRYSRGMAIMSTGCFFLFLLQTPLLGGSPSWLRLTAAALALAIALRGVQETQRSKRTDRPPR